MKEEPLWNPWEYVGGDIKMDVTEGGGCGLD
jgi:hypothetical protein